MRRMRKQYEEFGYNGPVRSAAAKADLPARADGDGRTGTGPVSGNVLRSERGALPREVARRARHRTQLHVREARTTRGRVNSPAEEARLTRRRRPRRHIPGMLLHIGGSKHRWFSDDRYYDLLVILDDARMANKRLRPKTNALHTRLLENRSAFQVEILRCPADNSPVLTNSLRRATSGPVSE
jgi:hypothetical protein